MSLSQTTIKNLSLSNISQRYPEIQKGANTVLRAPWINSRNNEKVSWVKVNIKASETGTKFTKLKGL